MLSRKRAIITGAIAGVNFTRNTEIFIEILKKFLFFRWLQDMLPER